MTGREGGKLYGNRRVHWTHCDLPHFAAGFCINTYVRTCTYMYMCICPCVCKAATNELAARSWNIQLFLSSGSFPLEEESLAMQLPLQLLAKIILHVTQVYRSVLRYAVLGVLEVHAMWITSKSARIEVSLAQTLIRVRHGREASVGGEQHICINTQRITIKTIKVTITTNNSNSNNSSNQSQRNELIAFCLSCCVNRFS